MAKKKKKRLLKRGSKTKVKKITEEIVVSQPKMKAWRATRDVAKGLDDLPPREQSKFINF